MKMSTHKSSAVQQDFEEVRLERMFEEDYLRSYAYKAAALSKEDAVSEQPLEEWKFYKNPIMTAKGKRIVCDDPNISNDTLEKLIVSEHEYLSCKENSWLLSKSKQEIYDYVLEQYPAADYEYSIAYSLDEIRPRYKWNESCQGSVPALWCRQHRPLAH